MIDAGIDISEHEQYQLWADTIGNLELLLPAENIAKSDQSFEQWLSTRDAAFKKRHLIPDDANLLKMESFGEFIKARQTLIVRRLGNLFSFDPLDVAD